MFKLLKLEDGLPFYSQLMVLRYNQDDDSNKYLVKSFNPLLTFEHINKYFQDNNLGTLKEFKNAYKYSYYVEKIPELKGTDHSQLEDILHVKTPPISNTKVPEDHSTGKDGDNDTETQGSSGNVSLLEHDTKERTSGQENFLQLSQYLLEALNDHRALYKRVDLLQKLSDEYMSRYDMNKELEKRLRDQKVVDAEGFELVTSGPKPKVMVRLNKNKKKKTLGSKNLTDFYKFQRI